MSQKKIIQGGYVFIYNIHLKSGFAYNNTLNNFNITKNKAKTVKDISFTSITGRNRGQPPKRRRCTLWKNIKTDIGIL